MNSGFNPLPELYEPNGEELYQQVELAFNENKIKVCHIYIIKYSYKYFAYMSYLWLPDIYILTIYIYIYMCIDNQYIYLLVSIL